MAILTVRGHTCAVDAVLFDKDGTLIEFDPLWCGWALTLSEQLSQASGVPVDRLAAAIGIDPEVAMHVPEGPLAVGTLRDLAAVLAYQLYEHGLAWGAAREMVEQALASAEPALGEQAQVHPLPGANALLQRLSELGVAGGVVTSDDTPRAREHLRLAGMDRDLAVVIGADRVSDGGKPAPGGILLACTTLDVTPGRVVMVGDSEGDMRAASAAGLAAGFQLTTSDARPHTAAHHLSHLDEIELAEE